MNLAQLQAIRVVVAICLATGLGAVAQAQTNKTASSQEADQVSPPTNARQDTESSEPDKSVPVSTVDAPKTQGPRGLGPSSVPSAESVVQELLQKRQQSQETGSPAPPKVPSTLPAGLSPVDPSVFGSAPHLPKITLRREGEFINARRGRIIRSPDGSCLLFVFEADDETSPEPPMVLAPCQLTERLENMVKERGERLLFIASGQVLVYHGVNYLLPTVMKETFDRGNLQP